jgi:hypothetical protein
LADSPRDRQIFREYGAAQMGQADLAETHEVMGWRSMWPVAGVVAGAIDVAAYMSEGDYEAALKAAGGAAVGQVPLPAVGKLLKAVKPLEAAAKGAEKAWPSAKGLVGEAFENYLTKNIGGSGKIKIKGREVDGGTATKWWEAKSGNYWNRFLGDEQTRANFFSSMPHYKKLANESGATFEVFSNTAIPQEVKDWLTQKGIPYTEILN